MAILRNEAVVSDEELDDVGDYWCVAGCCRGAGTECCC